jgi:hypothetical protein
MLDSLFWLSRPLVWRWRLGYWDWDAIRTALELAWRGSNNYRRKHTREARSLLSGKEAGG